MWGDRFDSYFDGSNYYPAHDLLDLDTLDEGAASDIIRELDAGSDFKLLIGHIIGIDSAGHSTQMGSGDMQRKIRDTDRLLRQIIDKIDEHTTLLVFGDHGMTVDGNHGGSSEAEMATVLLSYQKRPFAAYDFYQAHKSLFYDMDREVKIIDLPAIVSAILDLPLPFVNLGVAHPVFTPSGSATDAFHIARRALQQVTTYVETYCQRTQQGWCAGELAELTWQLHSANAFDPTKVGTERTLEKIDSIHEFLNQKFQTFTSLWTEFDVSSFTLGAVTGIWLVLFQVSQVFGNPNIQTSPLALPMILAAFAVYVTSLLGIVPLEVAAVAAIGTSAVFGFSRLASLGHKLAVRVQPDRLVPKQLIYPGAYLLICGGFILTHLVDSMQ